MKHPDDTKTMELIPVVRGRGRPPTGEGKSAAQRQAIRRSKLREAGLVPITVNIPVDLRDQLKKFLEFKPETKDQVIERFLRNALRKR